MSTVEQISARMVKSKHKNAHASFKSNISWNTYQKCFNPKLKWTIQRNLQPIVRKKNINSTCKPHNSNKKNRKEKKLTRPTKEGRKKTKREELQGKIYGLQVFNQGLAMSEMMKKRCGEKRGGVEGMGMSWGWSLLQKKGFQRVQGHWQLMTTSPTNQNRRTPPRVGEQRHQPGAWTLAAGTMGLGQIFENVKRNQI